MSDSSPCLTCGACCAFFRVSFFWGECRSAGGTVPDEKVVQISPHHVAMIGTDAKPVRCTELMGTVGQGVRCTLYELRSSACRDFEASWENGEHNPRCDDARRAHGLEPLSRPQQPSITPERVA